MTTPRPASAYVHGVGAPVVVVPGRVAALLDNLLDLTRLRVEVRGQDAELDAVLVALRVAAANWRTTATGSPHPPAPEAATRSTWLSTAQAADILGVTDRAVRLAITEHRLNAQQIDGRWRISREDLEHFRAARAA